MHFVRTTLSSVLDGGTSGPLYDVLKSGPGIGATAEASGTNAFPAEASKIGIADGKAVTNAIPDSFFDKFTTVVRGGPAKELEPLPAGFVKPPDSLSFGINVELEAVVEYVSSTQPEVQSKVQPQVKHDVLPKVMSEILHKAQSEVQLEAQPEIRTECKSTLQPEFQLKLPSKAETKSELQPEPQAKPKPEQVQFKVQPEVQSEFQLGIQPEVESGLGLVPLTLAPPSRDPTSPISASIIITDAGGLAAATGPTQLLVSTFRLNQRVSTVSSAGDVKPSTPPSSTQDVCVLVGAPEFALSEKETQYIGFHKKGIKAKTKVNPNVRKSKPLGIMKLLPKLLIGVATLVSLPPLSFDAYSVGSFIGAFVASAASIDNFEEHDIGDVRELERYKEGTVSIITDDTKQNEEGNALRVSTLNNVNGVFDAKDAKKVSIIADDTEQNEEDNGLRGNTLNNVNGVFDAEDAKNTADNGLQGGSPNNVNGVSVSSQVGACDGDHCCYNHDCHTGFCAGGHGVNCKCKKEWFGNRFNTGQCISKRSNQQQAYNGDHNSCQHGGVCGWCGPKQRADRKCSKNSDCETNWCNGSFTVDCRGTCASKRSNHQEAYNGDYNSCTHGNGVCGWCGPKQRKGRKCSEDSDCETNWCDGSVTFNCGSSCGDKKNDGEKCPQRPISRDGIDNACKSGECMGMMKTQEWNTNAYCRPNGGFIGGQPCTQDSDCSGAGRGHWCNGGAWNSYGKCELCPAKCNGGCHACDNDKSRLNCGYSDALDKFACGAEVAASTAVDFLECMMGEDLACLGEMIKETSDCASKGECIFEIGEDCLNYQQDFELELSQSYGALTVGVTGDMYVDVGLRLKLNPKDWTFTITFIAKVVSNLGVNLDASYSYEKAIKKKLGRKKRIMKKVIMVGKIPVLLEMDIEPRMWADLSLEAEMNANMKVTSSITYTQSVVLNIKQAELSATRGQLDTGDLFKIEELSVEGNFKAKASIRVGPRIQLSVYKIPITLDLAGRLSADVAIGATASGSNKEACLKGSVGMSAGIDIRFSALFTALNPIVFAEEMCNEAGSLMLELMNPANAMIDRAQCFTDIVDIDTSFVDDAQEEITEELKGLVDSICEEVIDLIVPDALEEFVCKAVEGANALQSDWVSVASFNPTFGVEFCAGTEASAALDSSISSDLSGLSACGGDSEGHDPEEEDDEDDDLFATVSSHNPNLSWIVGGAGKSCGKSCGDIGKTCDSSVRTNSISQLKDRLTEAGERNPKIYHGSWRTGFGLNPAYLGGETNEWVLGKIAPDCSSSNRQRSGLCHCEGGPTWVVGGAGKSCGESCGAIGKTCTSSVRTNSISQLEDRLNKAGERNPKISHGLWKTGSGLNPAYLRGETNEWVLGKHAPDCHSRVLQRSGLCQCM